MRISSYLHLTRFVRLLLDRKDRMSMAVGLEVRVPFCDHRLVEYVYNAPWALKTYDGREKSLLRGAARDLLPRVGAPAVKSPYPSTQDWHYALDLQQQVRVLLEQRGHDVFELVDRAWLDAVTTADPADVVVADRQGLEWTLNLATWLDIYKPQLDVSEAHLVRVIRQAARALSRIGRSAASRRASSSSMVAADRCIISLGCSRPPSSTNSTMNGIETVSRTGTILSAAATACSIFTAREPAATPP